jgi:cytochrome d ubiquinol oxidase subunit II
MDLHITWFVLWGLLWAVYFMLDGFVMGTGMLHTILGKNETQRRMLAKTVGPVWDGNEVWLVTAGGATFAAFPTTYALMFSYLYTALLLLLFSLIIRGVSIEFRSKEQPAFLKKLWETGITVGGFIPALLFGVAFGNIFAGLPMNANGFQGNFFSLLNPFGIVTGLLFVMLFMVHGALYASIKTTATLSERAEGLAKKLWPLLLIIAVVFLAMLPFSTKLLNNFLAHPYLFAVPLLAVGALVSIRVFLGKKNAASFTASCVTIVAVVATGIIGLFPSLIPSSIDPAYSLTIFNSSSSDYTLKLMTIVAFIFVPIVIAYKIWVYRVFRAPVTEAERDEMEY